MVRGAVVSSTRSNLAKVRRAREARETVIAECQSLQSRQSTFCVIMEKQHSRELFEFTPPELKEIAERAAQNLLPAKSKGNY